MQGCKSLLGTAGERAAKATCRWVGCLPRILPARLPRVLAANSSLPLHSYDLITLSSINGQPCTHLAAPRPVPAVRLLLAVLEPPAPAAAPPAAASPLPVVPPPRRTGVSEMVWGGRGHGA